MTKWAPWELCYDEEDIETVTSMDQIDVEISIQELEKHEMAITRNKHRDYLLRCISSLSWKFEKQCYQDPWYPYWFLNSMSLLKLNKISGYDFYTSSIIGFLKKRIAEDGGYAPSPEQKGHTILSYTAINSLAIIGTEEAYKSIDRPKLYQFLLNMKNPDGSFSANEGCEEDVRSTYCALCVASLLNMLTPELSKGSAEFIRSCQGYDGGFAPLPNCETHGGYGFCALGGLKILNRIDIINVNSAIGWCARRQMPFSGGFNGRTNKLVDTCYTWWVGAMAASLSEYTGLDSFWDEKALTSWVVNVCQSQDGGFYDKPGKPVDLFHTMYGLAGLSAAARNAVKELTGFELSEVDSCYAIPKESVAKIKQYFADKPFPS